MFESARLTVNVKKPPNSIPPLRFAKISDALLGHL